MVGVLRSRFSAETHEELREYILNALSKGHVVESVSFDGRRWTASEVAEFVERTIAQAPRPMPISLPVALWRFLPELGNLRMRETVEPAMVRPLSLAELVDG
jgi:hypothetical protein